MFSLPGGWVYFLLGTALFLYFLPLTRKFCEPFLLLAVFGIGNFIASHQHKSYPQENIYLFKGRCEEKLPYNQYILSAGHSKFYLNPSIPETIYHQGDTLSFYTSVAFISDISNPGEFNTAQYLKQKNVFHRLLPLSEITQKHSQFLPAFSVERFRKFFIQKSQLLTQDSVCQMLMQAVCLGYKNDLHAGTKHLFIQTGTIHLLAVSGLHTGAIYLLLCYVFKYIGLRGPKKELYILPLLWMYACLTGLSPSVIRAATILSFISIGKAFNKNYIPLNALAASAFFSLLLQPHLLQSLSFLLSYSAYTGILTIYPLLLRLPGKLSPVLSHLYKGCCISIAAQIPTLPIAAFYFHTIPLNSFLINIIAIPIATLFLYSSAICLLLPVAIAQYLIILPENLCRLLLYTLKIFRPFCINLNQLYPTSASVLLGYTCLFCLLYYLSQRKKIRLLYSALSLIILIAYLTTLNIWRSSQKEIVIFHFHQKTGILLNYKGFYTLLTETPSVKNKFEPYILSHKLKPLPSSNDYLSESFWLYRSHLQTSRDTIGILTAQHKIYKPCQSLIITDNLLPRQIFPDTMSLTLPSRVILDGSNNKYTRLKWNAFCQKYNILFRTTYTEGCIRISLK